MSFLELKQQTGRIPVTIFQIDLDKNDPAFDDIFSDDMSSYGTPKTTNDIRAYKEGEIKTYSFASCHLFGLNTLPGLLSATSEPPKVSPNKDIGIRATASITLTDFESTDSFELTGLYSDRRVRASFWAKMFARNEFKYRDARILRGYVEDDGFTFDISNFQVEHYIIDDYQGPDLSGNVKFSLLDVLALTDGINIKIPDTTSGLLGADLTETATTCTFNALDTAAEYGTSGVWVIGSEAMQYTITTPTTATLVRGILGTTAATHNTNESIQKCIYYNDVNVIDIIKDLLAYTKIPSSYIPVAKWDALKADELSLYKFTALIYEPTEVKQLLNELIEHASLTMYTDVNLQEITILNNSLISEVKFNFDLNEHIIKGSFSHENKFSDIVTNQFIRWNLKNYLNTDNVNYRNNKKVVDIYAEDASRLRIGTAGKEIKSRWLGSTVDNSQVASLIATRKVAYYSSVPKQVKFRVDAAYIGDITEAIRFWLGTTFSVTFPKNCAVNPDGSDYVMIAQCTSIRAVSNNEWEITGLSFNANLPPTYDYIIPAGTYIDYVLATDPDFAALLSAGGAKEYVVYIEQGAVFGSSSVGIPSFRQGTFPSGATLYIINIGQSIGHGGKGGRGSDTEFDAETNTCFVDTPGLGEDGGSALELTTDTTIDNTFGLIAAGGKGGTGGTGACDGSPIVKPGAGGGGGQGFYGGLGGDPGDGLPVSHGAGTGGVGSKDAPGTGGAGYTSAQNGNVGGELGGGIAIKTNGHTLTIVGGDNASQIRGIID